MDRKPLGYRGIKYDLKSRQRLYDQAFKEVRADHGTSYPCTQADIDIITATYPTGKMFSWQDLFSIDEATKSLEDYLQDGKYHTGAFSRALDRLRNLLALKEEDCGPDLVVKSLNDWDEVFFHGRLRDKIIIKWKGYKSTTEPMGRCYTHGSVRSGRWCMISLNAHEIFKKEYDKEFIKGPFSLMISVLLHEMVVGFPHPQF